MANLKTLKHFKSGYDPRRNTKGRPPVRWDPWRDALEKELKKRVITPGGSEVTTETAIVMRLIQKALKGDLSAMKLFLDYRFGRPKSQCARCERRDAAILEERRLREDKQRTEDIEKEVDEWMKNWGKDSGKK